MSKICTARDFALWLSPRMDLYNISDIVLYGSVAVKGDGKDIDLLVLHDNFVFDEFSRYLFENPGIDDKYSFIRLNNSLKSNNYPGIEDLLGISSCRKAIEKDILSIKLVNEHIFKDPKAYQEELKLNSDPNFFKNVLS